LIIKMNVEALNALIKEVAENDSIITFLGKRFMVLKWNYTMERYNPWIVVTFEKMIQIDY